MPAFRFHIWTAALLTAVNVGGAAVRAQSLGDVARQEEERRKAVQGASRVYTNKDLKDVPPPAATPAPASEPAVEPAKADGKAETKPDSKEAAASPERAPENGKEVTKDAAYWHGRVKALQDALERDQIYADALQSRISALTTDFVNRDDPVQRATVAADRDKATAELERLKKTILEDRRAITDLDEEARRTGVPPGWLR